MDETFGERLKKARVRKKISGEKLAEMLGHGSKQTVSNWQADRAMPDMKIITKIAEILQVSVAWLITGRDDKTYQVPEDKVLIAKDEYIEYLNWRNSQQEAEIERLRKSGNHADKQLQKLKG